MAAVSVTNTKLKFNEIKDIVTGTATAADGVEIDYTGKEDGRILLILSAGTAGNATIKKGDMLQSTEDLTVAVKTTEQAIVIESGKYVNSKGKVVISGLSGLVAAAIELP